MERQPKIAQQLKNVYGINNDQISIFMSVITRILYETKRHHIRVQTNRNTFKCVGQLSRDNYDKTHNHAHTKITSADFHRHFGDRACALLTANHNNCEHAEFTQRTKPLQKHQALLK